MLASLLGVPCLVTVTLLCLTEIPLLETLKDFLLVAALLHGVGTLLGRKYLGGPKYPDKVSLVPQPSLYEKRCYEQPLFWMPWEEPHLS